MRTRVFTIGVVGRAMIGAAIVGRL